MPEYARKAEAPRIQARLAALQVLPTLGSRNWWPLYVFHFAALPNAISILESGSLACRGHNLMKVDTASPNVIGNTGNQWKAFARFYFRPRTPTQHQVEGFRPVTQFGSLGKHCPMPFVLLFDAAEILTRESTLFSTGNMGVGTPEVGSDAAFFDALPFEQIYHDGPMPAETKSSIKYHRCAEVLVPGALDLEPLKYICCRSDAEYQTLWNSLSSNARTKYQNRFAIGANPHVHHRFWTFIESVTLETSSIIFRFNPSTYTPGPFHAKVTITGSAKFGIRTWEDQAFTTTGRTVFTLGLGADAPPSSYEVTLELNDDLAYRGIYRLGESAVVGRAH